MARTRNVSENLPAGTGALQAVAMQVARGLKLIKSDFFKKTLVCFAFYWQEFVNKEILTEKKK